MKLALLAALSLLLFAAPLAWALLPPKPSAARFPREQARRIELVDAVTGRPIVGVEDMALLPGGDTLILSAHDRRALEKTPESAPEGGLYAVSIRALLAGETRARPLLAAGSFRGGVFPHGIAVSADGRRLALVNRSRDGATSLVAGALTQKGFEPQHIRNGAEFCRANDLEFSERDLAAVRVTLAREACGVSWRDLRPGSRTGRVVAVDLASNAPPKEERAGLAYANGVAWPWVAETRGRRLRGGGLRGVSLPGGPDNLTLDAQGALVVALHRSLPRYALYRFGLASRAPSRIVRIGPDGRLETLFDDPKGDVFSGATVGVLAQGVLVAGSAFDSGVLLCRGLEPE